MALGVTVTGPLAPRPVQALDTLAVAVRPPDVAAVLVDALRTALVPA